MFLSYLYVSIEYLYITFRVQTNRWHWHVTPLCFRIPLRVLLLLISLISISFASLCLLLCIHSGFLLSIVVLPHFRGVARTVKQKVVHKTFCRLLIRVPLHIRLRIQFCLQTWSTECSQRAIWARDQSYKSSHKRYSCSRLVLWLKQPSPTIFGSSIRWRHNCSG